MKQRIISALIAIPLFLAIILFAPQPIYLAFWHLCIIACSYEFFKIRGLSKINSLISSVIVGSITPVISYLWFYTHFLAIIKDFIILLILCLAVFVLIIWVIIIPLLFKKYNKNQEYKCNNNLLFLLWFSIISYFYMFVLQFHSSTHRYSLLSVLFIIWANDAGAYFVGKAIGRHKFSPIISPNKTWEGFFGGIVVAFIALMVLNIPVLHTLWLERGITYTSSYAYGMELYSYRDSIGLHLLHTLFNVLLISVFATVGDLFQSMLKRMAGVKDSGNIMPGHGGVFDRIDSWLAVGSVQVAITHIILLFLYVRYVIF
ncbi:MAG: phosphatidate cytidylyltransferase [Neisseriaceae bacterium]|nr:phosphatidate cytidylyltransferase [Neisseriaceae bacterium]